MPGTLARHYAAAGGEVVLMGKPAAVIYEGALELLGLPAAEVVAVGDSLEHDIGGAQAAGVDSVFVLGGIHRGDVHLSAADNGGGDGSDDAASSGSMTAAGSYTFCRQRLDAACEQHGVAAPQYVLPYFA
jgi:beta-phosphoglucomutase-like phosphatase (HAD superfamily)